MSCIACESHLSEYIVVDMIVCFMPDLPCVSD